ncbi:tautomerase family protein [Methylobacterium nodulans]|uniref:4-oxalocrotonate tautomerase n=1 Tax=Methylobacterium nodulans (strain LMG 21967 / CNCM I-2342 / ORS 2060) TaxID=460265 RepID=B8IW24_METNO|nr:tautomerase family protein [Methylobacterium nodulans]ACL62614.1 4-oxalocrotonate tautomerase [Methylobacterium nodulans ORS 2060]
MPVLRFDLVGGRSPEELQVLLDAAHDAMLEAFQVTPGDRYQIVHEHPAAHLVVEDTGLGIPRTDKRVVLQVTTRPRSREMKETFYRLLCENLQARCGISPTDVVVSMVSNTDDDWSFGHGRAQFLTGEL